MNSCEFVRIIFTTVCAGENIAALGKYPRFCDVCLNVLMVRLCTVHKSNRVLCTGQTAGC
jgi:hypothetical protein